jgi:type IV secretory pathway VirB2 component (pilin)
MRRKFVYPAVYGVVTVLIGIGSTFYHMSLAFAGQVVDIISIYLLTSFMLLYNLSRTRRMGNGAFVGYYLLSNVLLGFISIRVPVLRRYIFLALLVAVLVSEVVIRRKRRPRMNVAFMVVALVSLVLGCTAWILDVTRVVCSPESWLQGHAMWHVLMAAVIGFMYLYYRSERAHTRPDWSTNSLSLSL